MLNRGGVRVGTAEFYRILDDVDGVTESLVVHRVDPLGEGPGSLVLLVALPPQQLLDDVLVRTIRTKWCSELSPRHVPDEISAVTDVPMMLSGKKLECRSS